MQLGEGHTLEIDKCDTSPLKEQIKTYLQQITLDIQRSLNSLDDENLCMLGQFERIRDKFIYMESVAASFYLNCYLSSFSNKYNELSLTLQHLSERRHGALIVVQREDTVEALIHSGLPVMADLTAPLLESIFFPGSPLHDGAVLIQANRIVSAANVLPLSTLEQGNKKLGTRHRAALGLSERCDALILVVSEETGENILCISRQTPSHCAPGLLWCSDGEFKLIMVQKAAPH
jgi:diadenylate cyclase